MTEKSGLSIEDVVTGNELYKRLGKTRIFQLEKAGRFPARRYFAPRMPFWIRSEVEAFFNGRVCAGCGQLLDAGIHGCPKGTDTIKVRGKKKRGVKMGKVPRAVPIIEDA